MLLGQVGPQTVGVATYGPGKLSGCAILAAVQAIY